MVAMRLSAPLARLCLSFLPVGSIVLAGCGESVMKVEQARTRGAAVAAGDSLPGATLERWLIASRTPPGPAVSAGLVSAWINTTLIVDAIRRDAALTDSLTTDAVILPDAEKGMIAKYFQGRHAKRPPVTNAQADSLYDTGKVRVFQQIVLRIQGKPDTAQVSKVMARARGLLAQLRGEVDFTTAVRQASEDSLTRAHDGFLPAMSRGDVPQYFSSIWDLRVSEVSELLGSPIGGHIIRRGTREEAREALKLWLAPRLAQRADSLFVDSVAHANRPVITADGRARLRSMAIEPAHLADGGPLVTWKGGELLAPTVLSAILILRPEDRESLRNASDSVASQYLLGLSRARMLIPIVGNDPPPNAEARAILAPAYRLTVDSLRAVVGRMPATASAGAAAAAYIDSIFAKQARYLPLPGALGAVLRSRGTVSVNHKVVEALVRASGPAWQEAHKDDQRRGVRPDSSGVPQP